MFIITSFKKYKKFCIKMQILQGVKQNYQIGNKTNWTVLQINSKIHKNMHFFYFLFYFLWHFINTLRGVEIRLTLYCDILHTCTLFVKKLMNVIPPIPHT